jgi:hypothetical protein
VRKKGSSTKEEPKSKSLTLLDRGLLRGIVNTPVSIFIHKWYYYIPRAKLTLVEGYWETYEEFLKVIPEGVRPRHDDGKPRHFSFICRPEELLKLAEAIKEVCGSEE